MRGTSTISVAEVNGYNLKTMPDHGDDPLKHLEQQRAGVWKELAKREPELAAQLIRWDEAIAKLKGAPGEYSSYRNGADAVVSYLQKHGPKSSREACMAVCSGGWLQGHPDAYWKLWDTIQYQLERSTNAKIVSLGNDIIGLPEHKKQRKK
jgi:hypothetical protein